MAQLSNNLPRILLPLVISGPQITKMGDKRTLHLVKYPPANVIVEETGAEVLSAWNEWWNLTEWVRNAETSTPRWNSPTRFGQVWARVGEAADSSNGHPYVYCFNCGLILQHPAAKKGIGTKHLVNHLKTQSCLATLVPAHSTSVEPLPQFNQRQQRQTTAIVPVFTTLAFEEELVRAVIDNNWSFRTVERLSFQRFIQFLRPNTAIISRYKFKTMFHNQFEEARVALLNSLGPTTKISIALDAWSAANHLSFLAVKGYYISQEWTLQEKLLDFIPMRGRHTGISMAADVTRVLEETGTKSRFLAITCDNASNNNTLTCALEKTLEEQGIFWSAAENTVPCLAHIINLVVQDIIQHLQLAATTDIGTREPLQRRHVEDITQHMSIPNSLRKLRAICIAIDVSTQRYERFIATQKHLPAKERLSVIRDVKTRWNSTFDMCARAVKIQRYIDEWLKQEVALKTGASSTTLSSDYDTAEVDFRDLKRLRLSSIEWRHLELITEMLKRFKTATSFLSENQKPQIQYIWLMYNRLFDFLDKMTEDLDEDTESHENTDWPTVVRAAAERGRIKLSKYYSKTEAEHGFLFNCATILDPTQKLTAYEDDTWDAQDKHIYRQQFLTYLDRYDNYRGTAATPGSSQSYRRSLGSEWFRRPAPPPSPRISTPSQRSFSQDLEDASGITREEGELYLSTACVLPNDSFDILNWWQLNESMYPNLSQVAKDVLAIPIAGVGVERVFNTAKDVIGDRRHRLSARTMQQIMVLKDTISQEVEEHTGVGITEGSSSEAPADEVDDLLELQAPIEDALSLEDIREDELTEEDSLSQQRDLPPRKRRCPERYRDN